MSFKLKEVVFRIRCTAPGCAFTSDFPVKENIMGATEADIDLEAWKIAKNQAYIKHDSLFGRFHPLTSPDISKISGQYDRLGGAPGVQGISVSQADLAPKPRPLPSAPTRRFRKGEPILRKGERATTVCEVVQGSAYNATRRDLLYRSGSTFGGAALLRHKSRLADIVAGEDDTIVAYYDLRAFSKTDPAKARALYNSAMEDIFHVLEYLEDYATSLEKQVDRLKAAQAVPRIVRAALKAGSASLKAGSASLKRAVRPSPKKTARPASRKTARPTARPAKAKSAVRKASKPKAKPAVKAKPAAKKTARPKVSSKRRAVGKPARRK